MYLYLEPLGGFNDMLVGIKLGIEYCIKTNRILLINGIKTDYNINFNDYLAFNHENIIYDSNEIFDIIKEKKLFIQMN